MKTTPPTTSLTLGQHLFTRDGRIFGNAIVTEVTPQGLIRIETDFGNGGSLLSLKEVTECWHTTDSEGAVRISDLSQWRADRHHLIMRKAQPEKEPDLLAVLEPVLDWYQSDDHPDREPLDILRDIVADLQRDRAAAIAGASDKRRLDWLESTQTSIGYNVECCAWGVDFEAPYAPTIREGIDAGIAFITKLAI